MINMNFMAPLNLFASIKKIYVRFIDFERLNLNFGAKTVIFISCPLFLSAVFLIELIKDYVNIGAFLVDAWSV